MMNDRISGFLKGGGFLLESCWDLCGNLRNSQQIREETLSTRIPTGVLNEYSCLCSQNRVVEQDFVLVFTCRPQANFSWWVVRLNLRYALGDRSGAGREGCRPPREGHRPQGRATAPPENIGTTRSLHQQWPGGSFSTLSQRFNIVTTIGTIFPFWL